MKKVLLIAMTLFFAAPVIHAKDGDEQVKMVLIKEENSDNYYYEGVVPVDGTTKEDMFKKAKAWVLTRLKTEDNNVQFDEAGSSIINNATIIIDKTKKGILQYDGALVNFKVNLQFKDGKYRFRFDNVIVKQTNTLYNMPASSYGPSMVNGKKYNNILMEKINVAFAALAADLENTIKGTAAKKDNW